MARSKKPPKFPDIDGTARNRCMYYTRNTKTPDGSIKKESVAQYFADQKESVAQYFENRFGYPPPQCFFGKPNGSLIYAGPITRDHASLPEDLQNAVQPELFERNPQ